MANSIIQIPVPSPTFERCLDYYRVQGERERADLFACLGRESDGPYSNEPVTLQAMRLQKTDKIVSLWVFMNRRTGSAFNLCVRKYYWLVHMRPYLQRILAKRMETRSIEFIV